MPRFSLFYTLFWIFSEVTVFRKL